jgi:hypothetical protein
MQPVVKQLQQLDYNSGNQSVFYVVHAASIAIQKIG